MGRIKLNVLGISYSQTQTGAYALVLAEEQGQRRIPIIVGGFEAQAIAIQLEGLKPPRPLTHDLFLNFSKTFHIELIEVTIYKLEEGVFYSKLGCFDGKKHVEIDARTSDAIALALRFKCPIFTTPDIIEKSGIILDFDKDMAGNESNIEKDLHNEEYESDFRKEIREMNSDELSSLLNDAIQEENYERASLIRDEINKRKKK